MPSHHPDTPRITPLRTLRPEALDRLIDHHRRHSVPRLTRLWRYYRNPAPGSPAPGSTFGTAAHLAQAEGLPPRLISPAAGTSGGTSGGGGREIVIENDIAWRVHTLADFMFAAPPMFRSRAADPQLAGRIDELLRRTFHHAGGAVFFQNLAVLSSVYGHADILAQYAPSPGTGVPASAGMNTSGGNSGGGGGGIDLSILDAQHAFALTDAHDYRRLRAYLLRGDITSLDTAAPGFLQRVRDHLTGRGHTADPRAAVTHTFVWTDDAVEQYIDTPAVLGQQRQLVSSTVNRLGRIPVIHIQNLPQPFAYSGLSDVEPLIPLQNELNTRLSDRANRLTFQAFKMYLGVGIERFTDRPVGPGQMWATDNPDARIVEFGGDSHNPSEEAHIDGLRDAMDKASAVSPLAAGIIRGRVGNLTSENALRIVLMGLLAKTRKKRMTFGIGLEQLAELILHIADTHGLLPNRPQDRRVRIDWPDPLPVPEQQTLENAQLKREIGLEEDQVLAELGYDANQ